MNYRKVNADDIPVLVRIHMISFRDFFLTSLGDSFLETYYRHSLKSQDCIAVCACNDNNEIVGFAVGSILSRGYHKRLITKNLGAFIFTGLIIAATKPAAIIRLMLNLNKNSNPDDDGQYAELLSIAVSDSMKGQGIGKELLAEFEQKLKNHACNKVVLTTDYYNNDNVIMFYKKQGYKIYYDFVTYPKRRMYKMIKSI